MPTLKNENQTFQNSQGFLSRTLIAPPKSEFQNSSLRCWLMACRPKTLTATWIPILCASTFVYTLWGQKWTNAQWIMIGLALLSAIFIQIGTNLINDSADFRRGADREDRLGPLRATQSGWMSYEQVKKAAGICFLVALLFGLPLVWYGGQVIFWIGLLSLFFGYAYTEGPFPLAYLGLGDLFVLLFFGIVAVSGMIFLLTNYWLFSSLILGLQIGFLSTVLIAVNNLRDMESDKKANKKTLAVRWGKSFSRYEIMTLIFSPYLMGYYWNSKGFEWAFWLPMITLPFAIKIIARVFYTEPSVYYNRILSQSALLHLLFGTLLSLGFILK